MRSLVLTCSFALALTGPARAQDPHAGHASEQAAAQAPATAERNPKLPAGEDQAKAALNTSPRHGEYVDVPVQGVPVRTWVVYPERKDKAPVVIVIHEIFGLSDWIRGVADQLAAEGFIAVAPDFLSGKGPNSGDSASFGGQQEMVKATLSLPAAEIIARIKAAREWALKQPRANG